MLHSICRYFSFERLLNLLKQHILYRTRYVVTVLLKSLYLLLTLTANKRQDVDQMPGPRLNAPVVYLKLSSFDPGFFRGWRLIGVWRLIEKIQYCCLPVVRSIVLAARKANVISAPARKTKRSARMLANSTIRYSGPTVFLSSWA